MLGTKELHVTQNVMRQAKKRCMLSTIVPTMLPTMLFTMMYAMLRAKHVMAATTIGCPSLDSQWPRWGSRRRSLIRSNILQGILTIIIILLAVKLYIYGGIWIPVAK